jgi:predicted transcriptional regulator
MLKGRSDSMEVHFTPELEAKLDRMASDSGRSREELVAEAVQCYFDELAYVRETLDRRYDELESGKVQLMDGPRFFEELRAREEELLKKNRVR